MSTEQRTMNTMDVEDMILIKATSYAHSAYSLTKCFPREEAFGLTSQLRRASVSVSLNIVEGYARLSSKTQVQFLKIAYGSLKEAQFIIKFAREESYVTLEDTIQISRLGDEIGKMLWSKISTLVKKHR
jgi:four helix bundle protein